MDIEIKLPDIGIDQAEVIDILVNVNDVVQKEQILMIIEGDKASMEIPSIHDGIIKEIKVKITDIVRKDSIIFIMEITKNTTLSPDNIIDNTMLKCDHTESLFYASPLVRRLARSLEIDLKNIIGSGRKNRIIKKDLDNYIIQNNILDHHTKSSKSQDNIIEDFDFSRYGKVDQINLSKIKQISGNLLSKNWSNIPHVTQFDYVDITDLESFRAKYNKTFINSKKIKITLLSFIVKAVVRGLEKFPYFNSTISVKNKIIFLKKYINIGIAVDTDHGLLVPVIKDVKNKNLSDISNEIFKKSQDARKGKLKISDFQGGCFTISSLGGIGGTFFTPIINSNEAAILGVSKFSYKPIWNGDSFIPKLILPLSLSYDHRIIDGAEGARFITFLNQLLSDTRLLLT